ncbi:hypothetical protein LX36DRAFT_744853 [Colletotrichum falcatum]|nr:hypothetical protein LX36DRAFT_744853 [Colletotrichum falcatum]
MEAIAQSRIIQFNIGNDFTPFHVHEASISGLSELLDNEPSQPGEELRRYGVTWGNVDVRTFATFLEYAYTGNFTIIDQGIKPEPDIETIALGDAMASKEWSKSASTKPSIGTLGHDNRNRDTSYSGGYYMAHCRLYLFACQHSIEELKKLCVEKVRQSFVANPGHGELGSSVVDMLSFIWPQTASGDAMRNLIFQYILTDMGWMMKYAQLNALLKEKLDICQELFFMVPMAYWEAL